MSAGKYLVVILGMFAMVPLMGGAAESESKGLTCPVSGKAIATPGDQTTQVLGRTVDLCCPGCESKVTGDLAKYMPAIKQQLLAKGELKQMTCPLSGKPINSEMTVSHEGTEIGFCCKGCKGKFETEAAVKEKTLKALPDTLAWFDMCPGSGKAVTADVKPISFEVAKGVKQDVYFCCPGCVAPFEKDPAASVAKLVKKQAAAKKS
jgi:YHS domain-containing protein